MFTINLIKVRALKLIKWILGKHLFHLKSFLNQFFLKPCESIYTILFLNKCSNRFTNWVSSKGFCKNTLELIHKLIHALIFLNLFKQKVGQNASIDSYPLEMKDESI